LAKCVGCAGAHYGRPKGWIAAVGVLASRSILRRKTWGIHSVSTYVREMVRRDFLDERNGDVRAQVIQDVIGSVAEDDVELARVRERADKSAALDRLPDEPFMLFVGALRRVKGIEELLAAYTALPDPPPLVLLGTIEPDSPTSFPPGVHLLADVPHAAVLAAAASDRCLFGVMPSLLPEPFGTVVCEVMSQGKPVIGTRPGGHTDMIQHGVSGLLVPRGDVAALVAAMQTLLDDPQLRERLGRGAVASARRFTADVALPRLERLYQQVIAGSPRGVRA
jgi:glycosyltransferase involved in cell wall biosynthesis